MSSPFALFRKNQRVWMAGLVLVAIISFVILPSFQAFNGNGQQGQQNKTLVSWKGGSLSNAKLERLTFVHAQTYRIFAQIASEVTAAGGTPSVPGFDMASGSIGLEQPNGVASVIEMKLMAEEARKHGVVVNDETVDLFIRNYIDGKISKQKFEEIVVEVAGKQLSRFDMYDYLKDELSKQMFVQMGLSGLTFSNQPLVAPSKNWLNFEKFQQRAKVEAFPIFVDQYIEKVTDKPSESELRALYEKGKDRFPVPSQPDPGFRKRYAAEIEYVMGDFNAFLKEEEDKITDEQLLIEYAKRVGEGRYKVPVEELKPTEPPAETTSQGTEASKIEATKSEVKSESSPVEPPATETSPAEASSAESTKIEMPSEVQAVTPEASAAPETPAVPVVPAPNSGSQLQRRNDIRLVAFQDESAPAAVAGAVEAVKDAAAAVTGAIKPDSDKPAGESDLPMATPTTADQTATTTPATTDPTSTDPTTDAKAAATEPEKPTRVQTLDEVRDSLKREIALQPASKKVNEAVTTVQKELSDYGSKLQFFNSLDPKARTGDAPKRPDLKQLSADNGLTYGKTGMVDVVTVRDKPIGQSLVRSSATPGRGPNFMGFGEAALTDPQEGGLPLYQPMVSQGFSADASGLFLFWKTSEELSRVLSFEEAREAVMAQWKLDAAKKLAIEAGQEIAAKVNSITDPSSDPWLTAVESHLQPLVIKPSPFTWLQPMFTGNEGIQLSTVEGIDLTGQAFMEKVFNAAIGKADVVFDAPQQKVFVLRVVERTPDNAELQDQFERSPLNRNVSALANQQSAAAVQGWFRDVFESTGLDQTELSKLR